MNYDAVYFNLLGNLLHNEPDDKTFPALIENDIFSELPFAAEEPLVRKGQELVLRWLKSAPPHELTEQAKNDYIRLFVGIVKVLAPPWGSCYMNDERMIFQKETLVVREFYRRFNREVPRDTCNEPDDHIGLELEFLSFLSEKGYRNYMTDFINMCMVNWIERWNADVDRYAKTDFYRGIANMAVGGVLYELHSAAAPAS